MVGHTQKTRIELEIYRIRLPNPFHQSQTLYNSTNTGMLVKSRNERYKSQQHAPTLRPWNQQTARKRLYSQPPPSDVDIDEAGRHDAELPSVAHSTETMHGDASILCARPFPWRRGGPPSTESTDFPGPERPSHTASANCRHGETQRLRCFNVAGGVALVFVMVAFEAELMTASTRCAVGHEPSTCTACSRRLGTTATGPRLWCHGD